MNFLFSSFFYIWYIFTLVFFLGGGVHNGIFETLVFIKNKL